MKTIYIAGPLTGATEAQKAQNVRNAIDAAARLVRYGYAPLVPHLYTYIDNIYPQDYERWMAIDFALLQRCDMVLRLQGESPGADREVEYARSVGIPVVTQIERLCNDAIFSTTNE